MNAPLQLRGDLTAYNADQIHKAMDLDGLAVRRWRNRGYFMEGEKSGKTYLYNIEDIAKLVILREMNDVGVKMSTAGTAANVGALDLVAHALLKAPLLEAWGSTDAEVEDIIKDVRADSSTLCALFNDETGTIFESPFNYLITGGDDIDDWAVIDNLDQVPQMEDFNLARIFIDLREAADRLIAVLREFGHGAGEPLKDGERLGPVAGFSSVTAAETKDPKTKLFSMDYEVPEGDTTLQ